MVADLYYCCGGKGTKDGLKENTETREDEQLKGEDVSLQGRREEMRRALVTAINCSPVK